MTARAAIVIFIVGTVIGFVGGLFKVQHWPGAGGLLITSTAFQAIGGIVLAIKVARYPDFKNFLDT